MTLYFILTHYHNFSSEIMCDAVSHGFAYYLEFYCNPKLCFLFIPNVDISHNCLEYYYLTSSVFLSLVLMGFRRGTGLWLQRSFCNWTGSARCGQWWGASRRWIFVFPLDTNTGLLYVIAPPPPTSPTPDYIKQLYCGAIYIW